MIAAVTGDLNLPAVPDFEAAITEAIANAPGTLIVDLSRVGFVGISGVQVLAAAVAARRTELAAHLDLDEPVG